MKRGFTLVEMLVVVSLVAILTGVGLATFAVAGKKSRDAKRRADVETIRSALELFRADNSKYPDTGITAAYAALVPNYLPTALTPPEPPAGGVYSYSCSSSPCYKYSNVCATLEISGSYCLAPP